MKSYHLLSDFTASTNNRIKFFNRIRKISADGAGVFKPFAANINRTYATSLIFKPAFCRLIFCTASASSKLSISISSNLVWAAKEISNSTKLFTHLPKIKYGESFELSRTFTPLRERYIATNATNGN